MKTVSFQAKEKKLGQGGKGLPIPSNQGQINMAGGPNATPRSDADLKKLPIRDPAAVDVQFPTDAHQESDPRDMMLAAKLDLARANEAAQKAAQPNKPVTPGVTPFGVMQASNSDFQRLIDVREKELELQFEQWFATNFDKMDVTHKATARQLFNKFYEDRLKNLDKNLETTRKIARLKITGPQTKEDLYLLYAQEAGLIDTKYLDNLLHPEKTAYQQNLAYRQSMFRRGLFNPRRFIRGDAGGQYREENAKRATNRNAAPAASGFGVNGNPFSAVGTVSANEEIMNTNFSKTLGMLEDDIFVADDTQSAAVAAPPIQGQSDNGSPDIYSNPNAIPNLF
jgi:hypothetical protein